MSERSQKISLKSFRQEIAARMKHTTDRPFLCKGNPLECRIFLVGFNPATRLRSDFWNFWADEGGFDFDAMMVEYNLIKRFRGVRPRLNAIVEKALPNRCLETNICSTPTRAAADLTKNMQNTEIFKYLYDTVKPSVIFAHSNRPINFFVDEAGSDPELHRQEVEWRGHKFILVSRPGPLFRCSIGKAAELGSQLASLLD